MASDEAVSVSNAPTKSAPGEKRRQDLHCSVCQIPVKQHVGKHGPGNCLGNSFSAAFRDLLSEVVSLKDNVEAARTEARDREARLHRKISELSKSLETALEALKTLEGKAAFLEVKLEELHRDNQPRSSGKSNPTTIRVSKHAEKRKKRKAGDVDVTQQNSPDVQNLSWADVVNSALCLSSSSSEDDVDHNSKERRPHSLPEHDRKPESRFQAPYRKRSSSEPAHDHDAYGGGRTAHNRKQRVQERKSEKPSFQSDDESWQLVVAKKPGPKKSVLYVGNLSPEVTAEKIEKFVSTRCGALDIPATKLYGAKMFPRKEPPQSDKASSLGARIVIDARDIDILSNRSFWPRPAYARPWVFRENQPTTLEEEDAASTDPIRSGQRGCWEAQPVQPGSS